MSLGHVSRFLIDARSASFNNTVYALKYKVTSLKAGPADATKVTKFDLNVLIGLEDGDNVQAKITTTREVSSTDKNVVTYCSTSNQRARYLVTGDVNNPNITFEAIELND